MFGPEGINPNRKVEPVEPSAPPARDLRKRVPSPETSPTPAPTDQESPSGDKVEISKEARKMLEQNPITPAPPITYQPEATGNPEDLEEIPDPDERE